MGISGGSSSSSPWGKVRGKEMQFPEFPKLGAKREEGMEIKEGEILSSLFFSHSSAGWGNRKEAPPSSLILVGDLGRGRS